MLWAFFNDTFRYDSDNINYDLTYEPFNINALSMPGLSEEDLLNAQQNDKAIAEVSLKCQADANLTCGNFKFIDNLFLL